MTSVTTSRETDLHDNDERTKNHVKLKHIFKEIKNSTPGVLAVFLLDKDGLPIEDVGLVSTVGRDRALIISALISNLLTTIKTLEQELEESSVGWATFLTESQQHKILFYDISGIAVLGILMDSSVNLSLIRLLVAQSMELIKETLEKRSFYVGDVQNFIRKPSEDELNEIFS